jgi:uncharacterized protein
VAKRSGRQPATVTVTGTGRQARRPDLARATFSVEATRPTAADARAAAAATAEAVIAALHAAGLGPDDLHTASLDVSPAWDQDGGRPVRSGFTVTTRLGAAIRDLDGVGRFVDAGLGAGATGLDGVGFELADPGPVTGEARRLAVVDARARASTIARAAGCRLGRLVSLTEGGLPAPGWPPLGRAMLATDATTPVLPGLVEVTVDVVGEWELEREAGRG